MYKFTQRIKIIKNIKFLILHMNKTAALDLQQTILSRFANL